MGHYTGAKARINRRLGSMIFESAGAIRASERRSDPPGVRQKETAINLPRTVKVLSKSRRSSTTTVW